MRYGVSFVMIGLALSGFSAHAMTWNPITPESMGIAQTGGVSLRDTMNFVDCTKEKTPRPAPRVYMCGKLPSPVMQYDYYDPVIMVEVSCKFGQSHLMSQTPAGKIVGKALYATVKAATQGQQKCQEKEVKRGQNQYFYEARAFGITLPDKIQAAGSGRKARAATVPLMCDILRLGGTMDQALNPASITNITDMYQNIDLGATTGLPLNGINPMDFVGDLSSGGGSSMLAGHVQSSLGSGVKPVSDAADTLNILACSPPAMVLGKLAPHLPFGLVPIFMSDIARPCWTMGSPADLKGKLAQPMALGAMISTPELLAALCVAGSVIDDFLPGSTEFLKSMGLGMKDEICVGVWGNKSPMTGYGNNPTSAASAALVGYRAYLQAVYTNKEVFENTRGELKFNQDYPFVNTGVANSFIKGINPFSKGNHGHKGSGCYKPGTIWPFYNAGESFLGDPSQAIGDMAQAFTSFATGAPTQAHNGDYVYTYYRNTRCMVPVECPHKAWKE